MTGKSVKAWMPDFTSGLISPMGMGYVYPTKKDGLKEWAHVVRVEIREIKRKRK